MITKEQPRKQTCREDGHAWGIMAHQTADGRVIDVCARCQQTRAQVADYEAKREADYAAYHAMTGEW